MTLEAYVSLENAKLLNERGFDEPCYKRYYEGYNLMYQEGNENFQIGDDAGHSNSMWNDIFKLDGVRNYSAPTQQVAMRWLREKYGIWIIPHYVNSGANCTTTIYYDRVSYYEDRSMYNSYEEACEAAIEYSLKNLVKN